MTKFRGRHAIATALVAALLGVVVPHASASTMAAATGPPTNNAIAPDPDVCTRPNASCADPDLSLSTGVAFHVWAYRTHADMAKALDLMANAGIRWVRIDMSWRALFPQRDQVDTGFADDLDFALTHATGDGMRVLSVLLDTPPWAAADGSSGASPPKDASDFGTFAGWVAANFGDRIDAYEIWNEPNSTGFFTGTVSDYAALLQAAYGQIKQWDLLGNTVVVGGLTYNDVSWLTKLYESSETIDLYFDVVGVHPYPSPADIAPECPATTMWRISAIDWMRQVMLRYDDPTTPIWITELGWSSHPNLASAPNWQLGVTEEQQADFAVRALNFIAGHFPYVKKTFWYDASDSTIDYADAALRLHENNFGLLHRDLTPKPAYLAVKNYLADGTVPAQTGGHCS
ncbi:MAG: polysaccharide biosynthesis protein PslG [Actinomycetota bacterium]|nr:polysaccharide biosynthesis protein PslG [Actinomycetota bacterium]